MIEDIVPEPHGGAHRDYEATAAEIKRLLLTHLNDLSMMNSDELLEDRYRKFRKIGKFAENRKEELPVQEKKEIIDSSLVGKE
ncbi:Acetyl-coenzyme A carboxylase carboxyl transferase subunit alpha [compost metagenome]